MLRPGGLDVIEGSGYILAVDLREDVAWSGPVIGDKNRLYWFVHRGRLKIPYHPDEESPRLSFIRNEDPLADHFSRNQTELSRCRLTNDSVKTAVTSRSYAFSTLIVRPTGFSLPK